MLIGRVCHVCRIWFDRVRANHYSIKPDTAYTTGTTNQKTVAVGSIGNSKCAGHPSSFYHRARRSFVMHSPGKNSDGLAKGTREKLFVIVYSDSFLPRVLVSISECGRTTFQSNNENDGYVAFPCTGTGTLNIS